MSDSHETAARPLHGVEPRPTAPGVIPLSAPHLAGNEWMYVKDCLDTNWVSSVGPFVDRFERELAKTLGTRFAVATVNGTVERLARECLSLPCSVGLSEDERRMSSAAFIRLSQECSVECRGLNA